MLNWGLLKNPLNWLTIGAIALLWIAAAHCVGFHFDNFNNGGDAA